MVDMNRGGDLPDDTRANAPHDHHRRVAISRAIRDPVIVVLALAGIFDGLAGNPVHAVLLIGVALLLGFGADFEIGSETVQEIDERWRTVRAGDRAEDTRVAFVAVVIAVLYGAVFGGFERYSWPATLAVIVPGVVGLLVAWNDDPGPEAPPISHRGTLAWATVFVALGVWELTNLLLQPSLQEGSYAHPTLSTLMDPILSVHVGRSIALVIWLALGWYLVRR
jgi:hypothetical protein